MDQVLDNFFNLTVMKTSLPYLARGIQVTAKLCLMVIPLGILGGLTTAYLLSTCSPKIRFLLIIFIDLFRAFPPLVLLVLIFYGLPFSGVEISNFTAVTLSFFLNTSSFYAEIFRAGIESIGKGQREAAESTGLSNLQTMYYVILPQATRNVLPELVSNTLEVVKLTSLASVVAIPDLLRMARVAQGLTFNPTPLVLAAGLYALFLWPVVRGLSLMERRLKAPV